MESATHGAMPGAPFFPETAVDPSGTLTPEDEAKFRATVAEIRADPTLDTAVQKAIGCCFSSSATSTPLCVALEKYFTTVSDTGRLCHRTGIAIANQRKMEKNHAALSTRCEAQARKIAALELTLAANRAALAEAMARSPPPASPTTASPAPTVYERHGMWGTQPVAYIEPQQGHTVVRKLGGARFSPTDLCLAPVGEITHLPRKRRRRTAGGE